MSRKQQAIVGLKQMAKGVSHVLGLAKIYTIISPYIKGIKSNTKGGLQIITEGFKHIFGKTKSQLYQVYLDQLVADVLEVDQPMYRTWLDGVHQSVYKPHGDNSVPEFRDPKFIAALSKEIALALGTKHLVGFSPFVRLTGLVYTLQMNAVANPVSEDVGNAAPVSSLDLVASNARPEQRGISRTLEVVSTPVSISASKLTTTANLDVLRIVVNSKDDEMLKDFIVKLSNDVAFEIDEQVLNKLCTTASTFDTSVGPISILINMAANKIARDTYRGAGNWVVLSNKAFNELKSQSDSSFQLNPLIVPGGALTHVGILNHCLQVYVVSDNIKSFDADVLVGYKGGATSSLIDAGITYTPYLPVLPSGIIINPDTWFPEMPLMTRGAITEHKNAENYYIKFNLQDPVA